jgi:hypothetical protein
MKEKSPDGKHSDRLYLCKGGDVFYSDDGGSTYTASSFSISWFTCCDWEIFSIKDLLPTHTFEEALEAFKAGKQIPRKGKCQWHDKRSELFLVHSGEFFKEDWLIRGMH